MELSLGIGRSGTYCRCKVCSSNGDGRSFRSFLVDLHLGFLPHHADIDTLLFTHVGYLCKVCVESQMDAHFLHQRDEPACIVGIRCRFEAGQLQIHLIALEGVPSSVAPARVVQDVTVRHFVDDIVGGLAFLRQQYRHIPQTRAIGNDHSRIGVVLQIADEHVLMHHGQLRLSLIGSERLGLGNLRFELRCPVGFEVDGIEQIGHHVRLDLIENGGNHAVCLLFTPVVDMVERSWRLEVEGFGLGVIVCLHVLLELRLQRSFVLVHEQGIGNVERHLLIHLRQVVDEVLAVVVYRLYASLMEAQCLLQFPLGLSRGSIVHHS